MKQLYVNLNTMNIQVPWIYVVRNKELLSQDNQYVNPRFDEEFESRQKELKNAIKEAEAERRQERLRQRRQSERRQSAAADPNMIPELNAYLST